MMSERSQSQMEKNQIEAVLESHSNCFVCGMSSQDGLRVHFERDLNSNVFFSLIGTFQVLDKHQGYQGLLHGGIASALVDAVMTNCLMKQGIQGLTAELNVKFHEPIYVGDVITIRGICKQKRKRIYFLSAQLENQKGICVSATGKFIEPR